MTPKNKKRLAWGVGLTLAAGTGYFIYRGVKKRMLVKDMATGFQGGLVSGASVPGSLQTAAATTSDEWNPTKVLKKGDRGRMVKAAQNAINDFLQASGSSKRLKVDGIFGSQTESGFVTVIGKGYGSYNQLKAVKPSGITGAIPSNESVYKVDPNAWRPPYTAIPEWEWAAQP